MKHFIASLFGVYHLIHFAMIVLVWIFSPILDAPWLHKMKDAILASPEYEGIHPSKNNVIIAYMLSVLHSYL